MEIESCKRKIINHNFAAGTGKSTLVSKICNIHYSASLVVDCKSLTLRWISLSLYKVVEDSYIPYLCLSASVTAMSYARGSLSRQTIRASGAASSIRSV